MDNSKKPTPGDILRKIRKELGFKQHELAADDITRNLISLIENNRATLNRGNAEILVKNMNAICKKRGIDIELEFRDLFVPGIYDAKSNARNYITYLKDSIYNNILISNDKIDEIALFISKWDLQSQSTYIYELMAQYFSENNDPNTSYIYYIKAFENAVKIDKNPMIVLKLSPLVIDICMKVGRISDALQIAKISYAHCGLENIDCMISILYKLATVHYKMKHYDEAIKTLNEIEMHLDNNQLYKTLDINILKILSYIELENYKKALETLKSTKNLVQDADEEITVLLRTIEVKISALKNNKKLVHELIDDLDIYIANLEYNQTYLSDISLNMAFSYNFLGNKQKTQEYINIGIEHAIHNKDIEAFKATLEFVMMFNDDFINTLDNLLQKSNLPRNVISSDYAIRLMKYLQINKRHDLVEKLLMSY